MQVAPTCTQVKSKRMKTVGHPIRFYFYSIESSTLYSVKELEKPAQLQIMDEHNNITLHTSLVQILHQVG
jgi:hypothetical protein